MNSQGLPPQLEHLLESAVRLFTTAGGDAILLLVDRALDWEQVRGRIGDAPALVAAEEEGELAGAAAFGFTEVLLDIGDLPVHERLAQALLECVADEKITPDAEVVAVYSG